jgi:hypothetical protein
MESDLKKILTSMLAGTLGLTGAACGGDSSEAETPAAGEEASGGENHCSGGEGGEHHCATGMGGEHSCSHDSPGGDAAAPATEEPAGEHQHAPGEEHGPEGSQ